MNDVKFNPDALTFIPGPLTVTFFGNCRVDLVRPKGDLYMAIAQAVTLFCDNSNTLLRQESELVKQNYFLTMIAVAARDQAIPPDQIALVERNLKGLMPYADMFWRLLELYRAVSRLALATEAKVPELLKDARQAWGQSLLRTIANPEVSPKSKNQDVAVLRHQNKALKARENPFSPELDPENHLLIKWVLQLTHWDEAIGAQEVKLPNSQRQDAARLRKDLKERLGAYRSSLTKLASHLDVSTDFVKARRTKDGEFAIVGQKNRLLADPPAAKTS